MDGDARENNSRCWYLKEIRIKIGSFWKIEILLQEADLAITDLTITSEREGAVDFTMPFMNLGEVDQRSVLSIRLNSLRIIDESFFLTGISILYRKPTKTPPSLFSFLSPFSAGVWWYLIGAYIFVSVVLFIIGRICPAEWNNPYPCIEEPEVLENQFTFKNSLWFTIGSIMQQGSEIAPMWVFFLFLCFQNFRTRDSQY